MTTNDIDARTIAADIMTGNARSITVGEIWAHIGQAYDTAELDASIADEVAELISKAGIDLIWPDGMKDTELGAARVEIERLSAALAAAYCEAERLREALGLIAEMCNCHAVAYCPSAFARKALTAEETGVTA